MCNSLVWLLLAGCCLLHPAALLAQAPGRADTARTAPPGKYDNVGSSDRLFLTPTARNLRRGEGYVQNLELALLNANYGITDNFSLGALVSVIPDQGLDNVIALTPKFSVPVARQLRVGAGSFLIGTRSGVGALTYANTTYGSADHNVTLGLGYGFTGQRGVFSTPLLLLGGATRIARRVSLVSESYFIYDKAFLDLGRFLLVAGVAGVRVAGPRFGGALGVLYAYGQLDDSEYFNGSAALAYPYGEFTVRFGKIK